MLDFKGFYDRDKMFWKNIIDIVLCSACGPPGGGRNALTARFVRHFALFFLPFPADNALKSIFKVWFCYSNNTYIILNLIVLIK